MRIEFGQPYLLLLAIPLLVHVIWMARRLQMLSLPRRIAAVTLRLLIVAALVCALAGMRVSFAAKDLTVFFVVDDSDSVPQPQKEYAKVFVQKAHEEMGPDDKQWIVMFGGNASIEQTPEAQPEFEKPESLVDKSRTNVAGALQLALACASGASQKRVVLLTDGNENVGSAEEAARSAAAAGVTVDVLPLKYETRNDVIVEKAVVENRVSLDQPFDVRIIATTRQATRGRLSVHQDGQLMGQFDVELTPGQKNAFTIPTQVRDAGFHRFEVQLDAEGDAIPENNRAFAFTYGEGEPRVLLVDGDEKKSLTLPDALKNENIKVEVVPPSGLPFDLRSLQMYDAVVFNNVAAADVTGDQMKMLEYAVHDLGIGFLMIGGENSFGSGGYNDSPIERILPVNMELKNERILPQGAMVIIMHTVEIPEGQYWAERIVHAALDVLSPRDQMGVLEFTLEDGEIWLFDLQEVGRKSHLRKKLAEARWGDMPSFDTTLQMAYDSLSRSKASVKHVVVISDGDPQTPNWKLVKKIQAAKITISAVCINPHNQRDADTMQQLAKTGGGNFYYPQNYDKLPQIFIREAATVRKSLIFEDPFTPVAKEYSPVLVGLGKGYPRLQGYVGTSRKNLADIPLLTDKDDPLFAHWRHGLGKTAAFTSDAKERWGKDWISWDQYSKFWSQTVRWILRSPFNRNFQVQMEVDGAQGKVIVDAVDDKGEFRNFLNVGGRIITPSLEPVETEFRQTAPGRYEATFPIKEAGAYMLGAQAAATDEAARQGTGELITGGTTLSYSPEFRNSSSNEALLYRLTDLTTARFLDEKSRVFLHDRPRQSQPTPLWPRILTILLGLFLLDVFVRRVLIGWEDVAGGLALAWRWTASKLPRRQVVTAGTSDQLLQVKKTVLSEEKPAQELDREKFLESLGQVSTHGPAVTSREPKPARAAAAPTKPKAAEKKTEEAPSFTGQLLEARSQARRRMQHQTPKPKEPGGESKPPKGDNQP